MLRAVVVHTQIDRFVLIQEKEKEMENNCEIGKLENFLIWFLFSHKKISE